MAKVWSLFGAEIRGRRQPLLGSCGGYPKHVINDLLETPALLFLDVLGLRERARCCIVFVHLVKLAPNPGRVPSVLAQLGQDVG